MSKLSDRRARHDEFHRRARKGGFAARAVFKLEEIDRRVRLLHRGDRVLDLGCAPGSWLQYAGERVGRDGALVGIDRGPIAFSAPNLRVEVGDVFEVDPDRLVGDLGAFDVVLSDMAPDTSGIRHLDQARSENLFERALEIAAATLAPGGNFTAKLFQGPAFQELVTRTRRHFSAVKIIKPKGSRPSSIEQYVVGCGFRGEEAR